ADGNEQLLWDAKNFIERAEGMWSLPLPYNWPELHRSACAHVSRSLNIPETKREEMICKLQVAADYNTLGVRDIESYLDSSTKQPYRVLAELQEYARAKDAKLLEKKVILKRVGQNHLRNADLDRLWLVAYDLNDIDYA